MAFETTTVIQFNIQYLQFLDENSQATQAFPDFAQPENLVELYRCMLLGRTLDKKVINLQRTGRMSTYPAAIGQEAISAGIGHALKKDDVFCPCYREQITLLQRGVKMSEILNYWGGDERGNAFENNAEDFPFCVPIATQCLHAAGIAYAIKYRQQPRAVLVACGDGATSKGDFYEAINVAGAWNLPIVFVINNNHWAISVPTEKQTKAQTLAQKAIAAGFTGLQVDGNDVIAVRQATADALEKARQGKGPTLIEALTYRLCDHTTVDDASRYTPAYVDAAEKQKIEKKEPIARLRNYLHQQNLWSEEKELALQKKCSGEVEEAVNIYLETDTQPPEACFDYLYESLPDALQSQRDAIGKDS